MAFSTAKGDNLVKGSFSFTGVITKNLGQAKCQSGSYSCSTSLSWSLSVELFDFLLFLEETVWGVHESIKGMLLFIVPASHPPWSAHKGDAKEMRISEIPAPRIQGQYTRLLLNMTSTLFNQKDSLHWPKSRIQKKCNLKSERDYHKVRKRWVYNQCGSSSHLQPHWTYYPAFNHFRI